MSSDNREAPLVLSNLTKKYGESRGITNINLSLKRGEIFGFLGPNGAGKSTTIKTIMNFQAPTSGKIKVFGLDSIKDSVAIKQDIGYLAGELEMYNHLTGKQILEFLGSFYNKLGWEYVTELADRFNAELNKKVSLLSKGNKQKIGIIQAFMHKPKLLILDEPTSGLDPLMQEEFFKLLAEVKISGSTVFFSTHNIYEVQKIADRAAFIRNGQIIATEDIKKINQIGLHKFVIHFADTLKQSQLIDIENIDSIKINGKIAQISVRGSINSLIKQLAKYNVISIEQQETNLEDIFLKYYQESKSKNENS